jgi:ABC-type nickel/cobalt efflux system permease component RcnA
VKSAIRYSLFAIGVALVFASSAAAHPLGNFSMNHLTRVSASADRVDVVYVLDQAEIPTFQQRGLSSAERLVRVRDEVARRLAVVVDGRPARLAELPGANVQLRPGQGGLKTTRVELRLRAPARGAGRVEVRDGTYPGRVGWKAVIAAPGGGTAVRSDVPAGDPTNGLRVYPERLLQSPSDVRKATLALRPGHGTLDAPDGPRTLPGGGGGHSFADLFENAAAGRGVLAFLLLAAFGWGALHALSPGHGKAMVAAYLIGTRGTARHAVALGATVTITHTIGVFALGVVTLALSQYILPEDLYPWLTLVSGLMVVGIGATVLTRRLRAARSALRTPHPHHHHHAHDLSWRGVIGMGAAAGLIPCPSALVVLLAAISQHEVALGLLLIVAFSLGLAATLTALGVAVVYAGRLSSRLSISSRMSGALSSASALVIVGAGCVLTLQAVPQVL